jgi:signal transduction histidine kinase
MFFRAGNASDSSTKGLGLGLYIAREIVTKHRGRIWLESAPDKGSTFRVALPIHLVD